MIRSGKMTARKYGFRTLVDVASIKVYFATLPEDDGPALSGRDDNGRYRKSA